MKNKRNTIRAVLTLIITLILIMSMTAITLADTADQTPTHRGQGFTQAIKGKLDNLVSAGTITQDQEDAVQTALTPSSDGVPSSNGGSTTQRHDFAQEIKDKLDTLVTAGTISQDQENAIQEALKPPANGTRTHHATNGIVLKIGQSKMSVNGTSQDIDPGYQTAPVIVNGRAFIPIRAIIESLGGTLDWSASDQKITITLNNISIVLQIGNNKATVSGNEKVMDDAPFISSTGRTMLPLGFITENLGHTAHWNDSTKTIIIQ